MRKLSKHRLLIVIAALIFFTPAFGNTDAFAELLPVGLLNYGNDNPSEEYWLQIDYPIITTNGVVYLNFFTGWERAYACDIYCYIDIPKSFLDNDQCYYVRWKADRNSCWPNCPIEEELGYYDFYFCDNSSAPPDAPTPVSPSSQNNPNPSGNIITFDWSEARRAYTYELEIATDSAFTKHHRQFSSYYWEPTQMQVGDFPNDCSNFYWRVRACNFYNHGDKTCSLWRTANFVNSPAGVDVPHLKSLCTPSVYESKIRKNWVTLFRFW